MHYFVTTVDDYCYDFEPEYTCKYFRSKEAMEAYQKTLKSGNSKGGMAKKKSGYSKGGMVDMRKTGLFR